MFCSIFFLHFQDEYRTHALVLTFPSLARRCASHTPPKHHHAFKVAGRLLTILRSMWPPEPLMMPVVPIRYLIGRMERSPLPPAQISSKCAVRLHTTVKAKIKRFGFVAGSVFMISLGFQGNHHRRVLASACGVVCRFGSHGGSARPQL